MMTNSDARSERTIAIKSRPGACPKAELATNSIFKLLTQTYITPKKFGRITNLVCDFMEDENGLVYLLRISDYVCDTPRVMGTNW